MSSLPPFPKLKVSGSGTSRDPFLSDYSVTFHRTTLSDQGLFREGGTSRRGTGRSPTPCRLGQSHPSVSRLLFVDVASGPLTLSAGGRGVTGSPRVLAVPEVYPNPLLWCRRDHKLFVSGPQSHVDPLTLLPVTTPLPPGLGGQGVVPLTWVRDLFG